MLKAAVTFLGLATVMMLMGFSGYNGISMELGKAIILGLLSLSAIAFVASLTTDQDSTLLNN